MKSKTIRNIQYELFLIPALLFYVTFIIAPMVQSIIYSFTPLKFQNVSYSFMGLQNYKDLLNDEMVRTAISYTLIYTVATTILVTLAAVPLALVLDSKFRGRNLYRAVFYFPSCVSMFILGFVFQYLLSSDDNGFLNMILIHVFHLQSIAFLGEIFWARLCTILICVWFATGWNATIYLAHLQSIPEEFYEAAYIDGASKLQVIRYITLPMLIPASTVSIMTLLAGGLRIYDLPFALTNGGPANSMQTITSTMIQRGVTEGNIGYSCALGVVFMLLILAVTFTQTKTMSILEEKVS